MTGSPFLAAPLFFKDYKSIKVVKGLKVARRFALLEIFVYLCRD